MKLDAYLMTQIKRSNSTRTNFLTSAAASASSSSFSIAVSDSASAKLSTAIAKNTFSRISAMQMQAKIFKTQLKKKTPNN